MRRIVTVDATGDVIGEWTGGDEQVLPDPPEGQTRIDVTASPDDVRHGGKRWTGTEFVDKPQARVISRGAFLDRFSDSAQVAIEEAAEKNTPAGRAIRTFLRRDIVALDSPRLTAPMAHILTALMAAGVPGWATQEEATASAAAIVA
jgi:hypothetical protein